MRIRISKQNDEIIDKLKGLYNFKLEGTIPRIAFAISVQNNKTFDLSKDVVPPSDGRDFRDDRGLFGTIIEGRSNFPIFKAILDQHYNKVLLEDEFSKLFRLHLDFGLDILNKELKSKDIASGFHINYLMKLIKRGLDFQSKLVNTALSLNPQFNLHEFNSPLTFSLGKIESGENLSICLNDLREFDSRNIAIAGMAGSGKTQLIKDILYQISENTGNQLKFIFFDYKGEGSADQLKPFLEKTNTTFVDILNDSFNFNPLTAINLDERQKTFSIKAFVDTVAIFVPGIGIKQKNSLQSVLTDLIESKGTIYPNLNELSDALEQFYDISKQKPDSLTAVIKDLSSGLFSELTHENIIEKNIYLNLPPALSDTLRQLCVFLLLRYFNFIFSGTNDAEPEENIMPLRYIIVIDEAHVYLKNKNARKALEDLLRVMRSKGVIVVMLTQGVEDYKTKDFDFASQVKLPICLNIQNKDYKLIKSYIGTPRSEHKLQSVINKLESGKGIVNLGDPQLVEIRQFWKTLSEIKVK
jgi:DNA sulfur modification protein DndE